MSRRLSPTLEQVAAAARVSRATVSRVVNGSPKVSPEVVAAVNEAVARLNYVPNRAARTLVSRQTFAIALLVPEDTTRFFGDPYFASIVKGITAELEDSEYVLNLLLSNTDPDGKTGRYLQSGNVDGALIVSHHAGDRGLAALSSSMPVVFGGRPSAPELASCFYVDVDNITGSRRGTQHLVDLGRRRIATITGRPDMIAGLDRLEGWRQVMTEAGLPDDAVADGDFTLSGGALAMRTLLEQHPDLDAVFVASDLMARGALAALTAAGRRVPDDIAVVGYDDSFIATAEPPLLTTVRQPAEQMGAAMADLLLDLLAGNSAEQPSRLLPTELVVRETA